LSKPASPSPSADVAMASHTVASTRNSLLNCATAAQAAVSGAAVAPPVAVSTQVAATSAAVAAHAAGTARAGNHRVRCVSAPRAYTVLMDGAK
jgi:hypothetical protein